MSTGETSYGPKAGMGSHHSARAATEEWLTPPEILRALGPFDLDPCAPIVRPWPTADRHFTIEDDGLAQPWDGFVWLNPPYGRKTYRWLDKLADHGNGLALIFARTETRGFMATVWERADAMLFLYQRLTFRLPDGTEPENPGGGPNAGAPSVLIAYGTEATHRLAKSGLAGALVNGWSITGAAQRLAVRERL